MTAITTAAAGLFVAAWVVGVAAWFLGIAEMIATARFVPEVYRIGPCLLRAQVAIRRPIWPRSTAPTGKTASGRFKISGPEEVLFRPHMLGFGIQTPFPVKGIVRWRGVQANVEGRPLLASVVFFGAWLVGWTMGGMLALASPAAGAQGLLFLLIGWLGCGAIVSFSLWFELRKARAIITELDGVLGPAASNSAVERTR
jgi:hypothetical protein